LLINKLESFFCSYFKKEQHKEQLNGSFTIFVGCK